MRYESCVTSISWIPSEAVTGVNKAVFGSGFTHYDDPPPDVIVGLDAMAAADRFRFANRLSAWVDVEDGRVVDAGYSGGCVMGATTLGLAVTQVTFAALAFPDIQHDVEIARRSPVRADRRRTRRGAGSTPGQSSSLRGVPGAGRVAHQLGFSGPWPAARPG